MIWGASKIFGRTVKCFGVVIKSWTKASCADFTIRQEFVKNFFIHHDISNYQWYSKPFAVKLWDVMLFVRWKQIINKSFASLTFLPSFLE